jgi:hypothetical protein
MSSLAVARMERYTHLRPPLGRNLWNIIHLRESTVITTGWQNPDHSVALFFEDLRTW